VPVHWPLSGVSVEFRDDVTQTQNLVQPDPVEPLSRKQNTASSMQCASKIQTPSEELSGYSLAYISVPDFTSVLHMLANLNVTGG